MATQSAIANGITRLNQATFKVGPYYIRVDSIDLERKKLTEVKAGSSAKDDYIRELAILEYFLRKEHVTNEEFSVIVRDSYFTTGSPWDDALKEIDVTSSVESLLKHDDFIEFLETFDAGYDTAPQPVFGKICKTCEFKETAGQNFSIRHSSFLGCRISYWLTLLKMVPTNLRQYLLMFLRRINLTTSSLLLIQIYQSHRMV